MSRDSRRRRRALLVRTARDANAANIKKGRKRVPLAKAVAAVEKRLDDMARERRLAAWRVRDFDTRRAAARDSDV